PIRATMLPGSRYITLEPSRIISAFVASRSANWAAVASTSSAVSRGAVTLLMVSGRRSPQRGDVVTKFGDVADLHVRRSDPGQAVRFGYQPFRPQGGGVDHGLAADRHRFPWVPGRHHQ